MTLQVDTEAIINMAETFGYLVNIFGGERFVDYVSIVIIVGLLPKIIAVSAQLGRWPLVTREEIEASLPNLPGGAPAPNTARTAVQRITPPSTTTAISPSTAPEAQPPTYSESEAGVRSISSSPREEPLREKEYARIRKGWGRLVPEQKKMRWDEMEKEKKEQVAMLTPKLVERLRRYVEADLGRPGEKGNLAAAAFEDMMKREADDLKMEDFGVEVSQSFPYSSDT